MFPPDLRYTTEHEWIQTLDGDPPDRVRVGITDYAQEALGDIVFVTLPAVGDELTAGQSAGEIESTKSVSDLYAPVTGTVTARNDALDDRPELVNRDPYGDGWVLELRLGDSNQLDRLLDADAYQQLVEQG